jgi:hypothetical protein
MQAQIESGDLFRSLDAPLQATEHLSIQRLLNAFLDLEKRDHLPDERIIV